MGALSKKALCFKPGHLIQMVCYMYKIPAFVCNLQYPKFVPSLLCSYIRNIKLCYKEDILSGSYEVLCHQLYKLNSVTWLRQAKCLALLGSKNK